jgi:hypothetical protein
MVHDTSGLDFLVQEYDSLKLQATDLLDHYTSLLRRKGEVAKPKTATVIGAKMGPWGREKYGLKPKKMDALEFYGERLDGLKTLIADAQMEARGRVWPTAFVTFHTRKAQVVAARNLMSHDLTAWRCQPAPRPDEIVWPNLGLRAWERSVRTIAMGGAFVAMTLFFMIPVTAVQGIISTNSLVSFINEVAIINSIVTAILPGLALKIFLALVPMFIQASCFFWFLFD